MPKGYKIRRYRHIYKRRRFSPVKLTVILLVTIVVIFLGVSLYPPIHDFLSGRLLEELKSTFPDISSSKATTPPDEPLPETAPSSVEPAPQQQAPAASAALRAVYIPQQTLLEGGAAEFVGSTGLADINAVVIDLKDETGRILYQTSVQLAAEAAAQHENAIGLAQTVQDLTQAGYTVIGRLCAFQDPVVPYAHKMAAVKYMNSDWIWLDNAEEDGGKAWLNPYSPVAQSYIIDLAAEAAAAGVKTLLVDAVQFPQGQGLDLATYGEWSGGKGRDAVLSEFSQTLRQEAAQRGAAVIYSISAPAALGADVEKYGGANPAQLFGGTVGVQMMPASFGAAFEMGGVQIEAPAVHPYDTVSAVMGQLSAAAQGVSILGIIQGYTDNSLDPSVNKAYSAQDVSEQIRALSEAGAQSYVVLYEP